MESLYLLIPLSVGLVLVIIGVFAWALHGGQFEDLESEGQRILADESDRLDDDQENGRGVAKNPAVHPVQSEE